MLPPARCSPLLLLLLLLGASAGGPRLAKLRYDLWRADSPGLVDRRSLRLAVAPGAAFYEVMLLAANLSRAYRFEAETVDGAKYVNSIGGRTKNEEQKSHWMLYKLQSAPNPARPPPDILLTPKGINGVFVSDNDIYLFWFKNVTWA